MPACYAVIIPACNEEPCLGSVLAGLEAVLDSSRFVICVGVNGSTDRTAEIARAAGVLVGETAERGYGHGCIAAIEHFESRCEPPLGYIFFAADGANDARDIAALVTEHEEGAELVLGARTLLRENRETMQWQHVLANRLLAFWCMMLTGKRFSDLGSLRLIDRALFHRLGLREWTMGWTIEAQVRAAMLGARIREVPVREHARIAGEQKVSRVSWSRTLRIGCEIVAAGWRTRFPGSAEKPLPVRPANCGERRAVNGPYRR